MVENPSDEEKGFENEVRAMFATRTRRCLPSRLQVHESDQVTVPFSFLGTTVEGPYLRPDVKQVEHAHEMTLFPVCALGVEMQAVSRLDFPPSNDPVFCKHPLDNLNFRELPRLFLLRRSKACSSTSRRRRACSSKEILNHAL